MLTKRNLCEDLAALLKEKSIAFDVDMFAVDSVSGNGIADLQSFIQPGKTVVLIGSSGAGKITIIAGILLTPLFYKKEGGRIVRERLPAKGLMMSGIILAIMQWEHAARDNRHDFGTAMFPRLSSIQNKIAHERSPSL
ncbi:GTPase RsgA [Ectobacillus panaciterrae]|uniref:GTPase RsgA n=1 Tax=Ectobacillus panaciterrae TaxID=363872 RepID=UPI00041F800C|nr:GTPase RsgA [Ectobacillus panaciterrae]